MKNIITFLLFTLITINVNSQNINNKLDQKKIENEIPQLTEKTGSVSIITSVNTSEKFSGLAFGADISFNLDKNAIKLELTRIWEVDFLDILFDSSHRKKSFTEFNVLYGREFEITEIVFLDVFAGLGHVQGNYYDIKYSESLYGSGIGFPFHGKLRLQTGPLFSLGIQLGFNINNIEIIRKMGVFVQFNI
ncbi:hypothetical protein ACSIGC_14190 [Tenacibaculum sp. ZS6-P6]|uniref:hypothetical protein n=1 Tax=Tenacibaculum sp. ZS6-P6 TaxID=3447503 RepID=UPI003F9DFCF8